MFDWVTNTLQTSLVCVNCLAISMKIAKLARCDQVIFKISFIYFFSISTFRSSRSQMFFKVGVHKNVANFTEKHLCWSLFVIKLQAFRPGCNLIKKRLQHRCFSVKFGKFLRTSIFTEHLRWIFFSFQYKLHQNPNMYNYHGNGNRVGRSGWSDRDESFGYDINDASM